MLRPFIFDPAGDIRSDGVFKKFSPAILSFCKLLNGWVFYLLLISFGGLAGTVALRRTHVNNTGVIRANRFGLTALLVGGTANLLVLLFSSEFFFIRPGASIRPMGWAMLMFLLAGATIIIALPISVIALIKERPAKWGVIGVALSMAPLPFAIALLHGLSAVIGFGLAE